MEETLKLETSNALNLSLDEMDTQKIAVSDQTNRLQFPDNNSDSFTVNMDRLSRLTDKDMTANSRISLQRSLTRKVSQQRSSEKKIDSSNARDRDTKFVALGSPRASLSGPTTPEKPMVVTVETAEHPTTPQVHHQITIVTGSIGSTTAESRWNTKRLGFRRSPPSWTVDPRRILILFATLPFVLTGGMETNLNRVMSEISHCRNTCPLTYHAWNDRARIGGKDKVKL